MTNGFTIFKSTKWHLATCIIASLNFVIMTKSQAQATDNALPIADAHIHYSHDSVELTPSERVIEIMREANLKFALVSSSDDNGTQMLSELAPDLIVPGLRPYRRRGETGTWFTDQEALDYIEALLQKNTYASIGEFHLYGSDAELPIPQRIVELAEQYNLILHAHSDADAVERLLAQSDSVKIIWAHSGFDGPAEIASMLEKHDRLWADLAFRGEVGSGGVLSDAWRSLFETHPERMMLGTDTYTPERMYYIPDHASSARVWLDTLPEDLAENVAWKNAFDLIMPIWEANQKAAHKGHGSSNAAVTTDSHTHAASHAHASKEHKASTKTHAGSAHLADHTGDHAANNCDASANTKTVVIDGGDYKVALTPDDELQVSKPASLLVTVCGDISSINNISLDASMPAHGHGTNYTPSISKVNDSDTHSTHRVEGLILHMPGTWLWEVNVEDETGEKLLTQEFKVN